MTVTVLLHKASGQSVGPLVRPAFIKDEEHSLKRWAEMEASKFSPTAPLIEIERDGMPVFLGELAGEKWEWTARA